MGAVEWHVGFSLKRINDALARDANRSLRGRGVTMQQMGVLVCLDRAGGSSSLKELEAMLGVAQSTMWGIVDRLATKGLVELLPDEHDSRARRVAITSAGEVILGDGRAHLDAVEERMTSALTPAETAELCRLLAIVAESLDAPAAPPMAPTA